VNRGLSSPIFYGEFKENEEGNDRMGKAKKIKDESELSRIEEEHDLLESLEMDGYETKEKREKIKHMEIERSKMINDMEEQ